MKTNKKIRLPALAFLVLFFGLNANAQHLERTLINSACHQLDLGTMQVEWTVGELAVMHFTTDQFQLSQGFHQGVDQLVRVYSIPSWQQEVILFPNPASSILYLEKKRDDLFRLEIFDVLGKLLSQENWAGQSKNIDIQSFEDGLYLIRVIDPSGAFATYQFIKQSP